MGSKSKFASWGCESLEEDKAENRRRNEEEEEEDEKEEQEVSRGGDRTKM